MRYLFKLNAIICQFSRVYSRITYGYWPGNYISRQRVLMFSYSVNFSSPNEKKKGSACNMKNKLMIKTGESGYYYGLRGHS